MLERIQESLKRVFRGGTAPQTIKNSLSTAADVKTAQVQESAETSIDSYNSFPLSIAPSNCPGPTSTPPSTQSADFPQVEQVSARPVSAPSCPV